jgi:hypothetical protein
LNPTNFLMILVNRKAIVLKSLTNLIYKLVKP